MADEKEMIKKLFAIAEKQQKIIAKLAQAVLPAQHLAPDAGAHGTEEEKIIVLLKVKGLYPSKINEVDVSLATSTVKYRLAPGVDDASGTLFAAVEAAAKSVMPPGQLTVKQIE